jgi:hypothetical protein
VLPQCCSNRAENAVIAVPTYATESTTNHPVTELQAPLSLLQSKLPTPLALDNGEY